jgi:hypothetical protein
MFSSTSKISQFRFPPVVTLEQSGMTLTGSLGRNLLSFRFLPVVTLDK